MLITAEYAANFDADVARDVAYAAEAGRSAPRRGAGPILTPVQADTLAALAAQVAASNDYGTLGDRAFAIDILEAAARLLEVRHDLAASARMLANTAVHQLALHDGATQPTADALIELVR